jgi:hypothetical protein
MKSNDENTVKSRLAEMTKNHLGPWMKSLGFRRRGRIFWREREQVCQTVRLELSSFGTSVRGTLYLEIGVFWHKVEELLGNPSSGRMPPREYHNTFRVRLNSHKGAQHADRISINDDFSLHASAIQQDLITLGFPWLDLRSDLRTVLNRSQSPIKHRAKDSCAETPPGEARLLVFMCWQGNADKARDRVRERSNVSTETRLKFMNIIKTAHQKFPVPTRDT